MFNALVIDAGAVNSLHQASIDESWFKDFKIPTSSNQIYRAIANECVYLLSDKENLVSELIIIKLGDQSVFSKACSAREAFDRILHVAMAIYGSVVAIPKSWKKYTSGNRFAINAQAFHTSKTQRLYFERDSQNGNLIVYDLTEETQDFTDVDADRSYVNDAIDGYLEAVVSCSQEQLMDNVGGNFGIVLEDFVAVDHVAAANFDEWYESKLTRQQRAFVDTHLSNPVRLRGVAGTGKTLCLTIKCLRELLNAENQSKPLRIAFITHSTGVAHEVVEGMLRALDPEQRRFGLKHSYLWVGSLYELIKSMMDYGEKNIIPLSVDGVEGRLEQREYLETFIGECLNDTYFYRQLLPQCSENFRDSINESPVKREFLNDLMVEVSCVLDAEGIRKGREQKVNNYLKHSRSSMQMRLDTEDDRRAVLEIHERYSKYLAESQTFSLDQMVADFLSYLDSYEWSYRKETKGFDAIFIDELHHFNANERMVFHSLVKDSASNDGRVPLFMAYDLKQSPDDRFLGFSGVSSATAFFKSLKTGQTDLVELTEVFRSTPEIAAFLEQLDGSFPALDLEGEWGSYSGESNSDSGDIPNLSIFEDNTSLIDQIVNRAHREAKQIGGRHVAVLCMNEDLFDTYAKAGRIARQVSVVSGVTDVHELRYAGKRCILSMPEFVAGLQFESVYLIHTDEIELNEEVSVGARRRFLSRLYLGASRAKNKLALATSKERGGQLNMLNLSLGTGVLSLNV